jgi:hypothetical protein
MRTNKFFAKRKSAQAMIEFAIALPILLLLLYGILEAGRLLFLYSTVVTASRQAVRYGATTGEGNNGVPRYQDCDGIRNAANAVGYLGEFDFITLKYDTGPSTTENPYCPSGVPSDSNLTTQKLEGNQTRLVVTVEEEFFPIVPKLVPFIQRPIRATSARTILYSVPIVVEQEEQEWFKTPTITTITADTPDPSEIFQNVNVTVTVTGGSPTGVVDITGADTNCQITLNNGTGSCPIVFDTAGPKVITAFYNGDTDHLASSDVEDHTVTLINTVTTILSDLPDPSVKDAPFVVVVQVTGGTVRPSGTVEVNGGGNVICQITLSNGAGSCTLTYNNLGSKTLTATYLGDSTHLPSSDTESHEVIEGTPTPTRTPTATPIPTATAIPSLTPIPLTPTPIPSPVPSCDLVSHGTITASGNVMSMTINNPYSFTLVMKDVTVTWNDDKGHQTGTDKTLRLLGASIGGVTFWTGDIGNQSTYTIPQPALIPPGTTTISFTFNQSYDNLDSTENVLINFLTPGCEFDPLDSDQP